MLTIIASIIGFLSALIPEIFGVIKLYYKNRNTEIVLDKRIEMLKNVTPSSGYYQREMEEIEIEDYMEDSDDNQQPITQFDKLNMSVKPVLAYGFFLLYITIKCMQFYYIKVHVLPIDSEKLKILLSIIWSEQDQAFLPMIVSAYFGQRSINGYMSDLRRK